MGWIANLQGKTVGLDTAPLIYFIEENPAYIEKVQPFFEGMERADFEVVTSTVTLLEVLVHPLREDKTELAAEYRDILLKSKLITVEVSHQISEQAASLRSRYSIRTPDAIQLSTSLNAGASFFLTNDIRLPKISSIHIMSLDDLGD